MDFFPPQISLLCSYYVDDKFILNRCIKLIGDIYFCYKYIYIEIRIRILKKICNRYLSLTEIKDNFIFSI